MCECQISWIDNKGNPTPDHNPAIALAVCYDPLTFGEKGSEPFRICEEHAKRKSERWKLLPLPGHKESEIHPMVLADRSFKIIPDVVIQSIKSAFQKEDVENIHTGILKNLKWNAGDGCFYFNRWGMYVGIEEDGYIHT